MKPIYQKTSAKTGELQLYGPIGEEWDGVSAKTVSSALKELGSVDTINVFLNSPGGDFFDGVAIYSQLVRHRARINLIIDSLAASAASVIAMAGNHISALPQAMIMIHDPWTIAVGGPDEMDKTAALLRQIKSTIVDTYQSRTKQAAGDIEAWMTAETWMRAEEAHARRFVDEVIIEKETPAEARADLKRYAQNNLYRLARVEAYLARCKTPALAREGAGMPAKGNQTLENRHATLMASLKGAS